MDDSPLISVILPVYNCRDYIQEAIQSVLSQEIPHLELIVIDDGSTDDSALLAKSCAPNAIHLSQANLGQSAARNRGINLARGQFLAFIDGDDFWTENKLKRQLALFEADPLLDAVFGHVIEFFSPELSAQFPPLIQNPVPGHLPGTLLIRRESFFKVGLFSTEYTVGEPVEWYGRLIQTKLRSILSDETFLKRRIHKNNSGIRNQAYYGDYARLLKNLLDERRKKEHANFT